MTVLLHRDRGAPGVALLQPVSVARGERLIHLAGQVGSDEHRQLVPGGLAAQAERAMLNVGLALEAAGASEDDLVKLTMHVVDWEPAEARGDGRRPLRVGRPAAAAAGPDHAASASATLFEPEMLVEIEAVAVAA